MQSANRWIPPGAATKALDGVSLAIKPGEHVALIGRVGSGKSTLARMVLGLYPPQEGMVLLDGLDIAQLDPNSLRKSVYVRSLRRMKKLPRTDVHL